MPERELMRGQGPLVSDEVYTLSPQIMMFEPGATHYLQCYQKCFVLHVVLILVLSLRILHVSSEICFNLTSS